MIVVVSMLVAAGHSAAATPDPLADNAALHYWRAFAVMPNLTDDQEAAVAELVDELGPVKTLVAGAVSSSEGAMKELRRGASRPRCAWGTPLEDGVNTLLPHCAKARQLARMACAHAHVAFQGGRRSEAIDDLAAAMTLGRHLGDDGLLIALLVDYAIEGRAIQVAARHLDELKPVELDDFAARIDRLPAATTMRRAIQVEKECYLDSFVRELSKPGGKERTAEVLRSLGPPEDPNVKVLEKASSEELRDGAIALRPVYDKAAAMMDLPPAQMKDPESLLAGLTPVARALGMGLLPAAMNCRQIEVAHQTRLAMLQAAIAVVRHGPDVLKAQAPKDPYAGVPFSCEKTPGGFRLVSKTLGRDGKPVTLDVGQPAK
jgi:hypothetical protein